MLAGIAAGYGFFAYVAGRFLYPSGRSNKAWTFVIAANEFAEGRSMVFRTPGGAIVNITRRASEGTAEDFIALSAVCPHLGCRVHWEGQNNRYYCPCHDGTFDPSGKATGGPPAQAGQSLSTYPLEIRSGMLFIEVEVGGVASAAGIIDEQVIESELGPEGPGHDPCLQPAGFRSPSRPRVC
jgi:cytochrome b6-f complex iron-sulfur subunit